MNEATQARIGRLRWHSRRALLELDIVLERFWAQQGDELDETSATVLTRLLALEDHDLWDMVSGKVSVADPALVGFIGMLRGLTSNAPRAC